MASISHPMLAIFILKIILQYKIKELYLHRDLKIIFINQWRLTTFTKTKCLWN